MMSTQTPRNLQFDHDAMEQASRAHSLFDLSLSSLVLKTLSEKPGLSEEKIARIGRFERLTQRTRETILSSGNGPSDPSLSSAYKAKMRVEREFERVLRLEGLYQTVAHIAETMEIIDEHDRTIAAILGLRIGGSPLRSAIRMIHPHIEASIGVTTH